MAIKFGEHCKIRFLEKDTTMIQQYVPNWIHKEQHRAQDCQHHGPDAGKGIISPPCNEHLQDSSKENNISAESQMMANRLRRVGCHVIRSAECSYRQQRPTSASKNNGHIDKYDRSDQSTLASSANCRLEIITSIPGFVR